MSESFQHEIPKARVNITLDLETGGARKKKELPLKLLAVGNYSQGKSTGPIEKRERININKNNFDSVLKDLSPELTLAVPSAIKKDGVELKVQLKFEATKDFHPEQVAMQIPELRNLVAMRNLLKDLKANIVDNATLRKELEGILKDRSQLQAFKKELEQCAPLKEDS